MTTSGAPRFPLMRRVSGALIRLVVLAVLVLAVGWGIGEAAGNLVNRLPSAGNSVAVDHFTLAAGLAPAQALLKPGDLPAEWKAVQPTFGFVGTDLCGEKVPATGAKTNRLPTSAWANPKVGSFIVSEVVEFNSVQFASTYMSAVEDSLGKCKQFYAPNGAKRIKMTATIPEADPPVDDYASRIIRPEDQSSYQVLTVFQAGKSIIGLHYNGPIRPDRDVLSNAELKILRRIDAAQFTTTTTSLKGSKKIPGRTVVSVDSRSVSGVSGAGAQPGVPPATLPPVAGEPPPSSVAPEPSTTARSSTG